MLTTDPIAVLQIQMFEFCFLHFHHGTNKKHQWLAA